MNSSSRGARYYYSEEFEPPANWRRWLLVVFLTLGVAAVCLASMSFGAWMQRQVTPKPDVKLVSMPCPKTGLTQFQFQCSKQEFGEYREACLRRASSALTKPKE